MTKENIIKAEPHTIFLCIGPTNSGKSTFIKNILDSHKEELEDLNVQVIGSDQIRRELLGHDLHRYDKRMLEASRSTFDVFEAKLSAVTSYPINADLIFLDCTSLHPDFRDFVVKTARQKNYNLQAIIFDYKEIQDYLKFAEDGCESIVTQSVRKFRKRVLPELKRKQFDEITKVRTKFYDPYTLELVGFDKLERAKLDPNYDYSIIGDIHGCFEEFKDLLGTLGCEINNGSVVLPENRKIILIGDLIDKGPMSKEVIDFVHSNQDKFLLVLGNHEYGNYQYVTGKLKKGTWTDTFIDKYMDTIRLLEKDEITKNKLVELVDNSYPFLEHPNFVCTHVPCKSSVIGKVSNKAIKAQVRLMYPHREDKTDQELRETLHKFFSYLKEDSDFQYPMHVFGHVATATPIRYQSKLGTDLGCYKGGKLMSATFMSNSKKPIIHTVNSQQPKDPEGLLEWFKKEDVEINLDDLDHKDIIRIKKLCDNKVNFLSGTVCPADKDSEKGTLESLEKGLDYFKEAGVKKVHLQIKYMGSRGTVYLTMDDETSYVISRKGYKVGYVDFNAEFARLRKQLKNRFYNGAKVIVIDSEIMPWSAMGSGLIDRTFRVVSTGLKSEMSFLNESGFHDQLNTLAQKRDDSGYLENRKGLTKQEMSDKYGYTDYSSFRGMGKWDMVSPDHEGELIQQYSDQLDLYGQDGDLYIEPFCLLKVVYTDHEETFFDKRNSDLYTEVNPTGKSLELDFDDLDYLAKATAFYESISETMEGIVIKPEIVFTENIAPYMKVRNPKYMSIIYGYDYQKDRKYSGLIHQKRVASKLRTSINEFDTAKKMLEIPYAELSFENVEYVKLIAMFLRLERYEQKLDPRL